MSRAAAQRRVGPLIFAGAAILYAVAAWIVTPGFYDGISPPQPYNFVCPPAVAGADSGVKPSSGHIDVTVVNGASEADSAFTGDGQVVVGFLPGAFAVKGRSSVSVDIIPVSPCPKPNGLDFATNVYLITASAPLVMGASLVLVYSNLEADPSYVYRASSLDGPWTNIGSAPQAQFWTIQPASPPTELGYFAAGYPANAVSRGGPGGKQLLPAAVALLILGVLIAGIPLAAMRRRRLASGADEETNE